MVYNFVRKNGCAQEGIKTKKIHRGQQLQSFKLLKL